MNNFNQLKKGLNIGDTLTIVDTSLVGHKYLNVPRKIIKKQTNAVKFEGGSWLGLGATGEKAENFSFFNNGFTYRFGENNKDYISYKFN